MRNDDMAVQLDGYEGMETLEEAMRGGNLNIKDHGAYDVYVSMNDEEALMFKRCNGYPAIHDGTLRLYRRDLPYGSVTNINMAYVRSWFSIPSPFDGDR